MIDRSGSMRNEKIEQVKEAALQIIAGLRPGEAFNVLLYSNTVQWFSPKPVIKSQATEEAARKYIEGITATGGTNIHDALHAALQQEPTDGMLPIVLFLTDGLPTVGQTSEATIRELAAKSNPHRRRIFTFGVGFDVNAPLLEKIASESRGRAEFVLPQEDVEVKVGEVFRQLTGPVLAEPELRITDTHGAAAIGRTRDILPEKLPDLFEGDQLILLGQYVGDEPLVFEVTGNYFGKRRTFKFSLDFAKASEKNGFVPRLWASRKIAELIDAIRQAGADPSALGAGPEDQGTGRRDRPPVHGVRHSDRVHGVPGPRGDGPGRCRQRPAGGGGRHVRPGHGDAFRHGRRQSESQQHPPEGTDRAELPEQLLRREAQRGVHQLRPAGQRPGLLQSRVAVGGQQTRRSRGAGHARQSHRVRLDRSTSIWPTSWRERTARAASHWPATSC